MVVVCCCISNPSTFIFTAVGKSRVLSILIVVVFPAPLSPSRPVTCPGGSWKLTSLTAILSSRTVRNQPCRFRLLYTLVTFSAMMPCCTIMLLLMPGALPTA
jgi:hypothetical protein